MFGADSKYFNLHPKCTVRYNLYAILTFNEYAGGQRFPFPTHIPRQYFVRSNVWAFKEFPRLNIISARWHLFIHIKCEMQTQFFGWLTSCPNSKIQYITPVNECLSDASGARQRFLQDWNFDPEFFRILQKISQDLGKAHDRKDRNKANYNFRERPIFRATLCSLVNCISIAISPAVENDFANFINICVTKQTKM